MHTRPDEVVDAGRHQPPEVNYLLLFENGDFPLKGTEVKYLPLFENGDFPWTPWKMHF